MPESVSSDTIESLAGKLAAFADTLDEAERSALDQFFLQQSDVEGFAFPGVVGVVAPIDNRPGGSAGIGKAPKADRQAYYQVKLQDALISSYG